MGRIGETVRRTFQLAHVLKAWRRSAAADGVPGLPGESGDERDDTERVLRYLAKVTLEPAITHGVADHVGSLQPGRLADIVLWRPAMFGVKPEWTLKAGHPTWGPIGEGNATVERAEPTRYRPDWGGLPTAAADLSLTFVAAGASPDLARRLGTRRRLTPIGRVRGLTRADLARNRATAPIDIDPMDGRVTLGGRPLAVDPVREVPLSRRYLLR